MNSDFFLPGDSEPSSGRFHESVTITPSEPGHRASEYKGAIKMGKRSDTRKKEATNLEETMVEYVLMTKFDDLPREAIEIGKRLLMTVLGTTVAGATVEGCEGVFDLVREWGGREESTILVHGGRVPAYNAVFMNSIMARALDYCDGMIPGIHLGSTCIPTALAAVELAGGCSGRDFLTHLVVGAESAARINARSNYNGFDPTGVCSIFGATAIAGRMLGLDKRQMKNALGIAFNRAGGSLQSNIDGAGTVRMIQGFASQGGILSVQLAEKGITGPGNFLKGQYGYFHLYGDNGGGGKGLFDEWGERFELSKLVFKRYPSCWSTTSSIEAILEMVDEEKLTAYDIEEIGISMTPYPYKLVGHPFEAGENPRINAQFNVRYCVANALLRKRLILEDLDETAVRAPEIKRLTEHIKVWADPKLEHQGHNAAIMRVTTKSGKILERTVFEPRGGSINPLTEEEHFERFKDCLRYGGKPLQGNNGEKIFSMVGNLEEVSDVLDLIPLMVSPS
jgi:2-methylcitrate dehydratase PrpD